MNPKSTLLACALFSACLTLAAQANMGSSTSEVAGSLASPHSFVSGATFDHATPLYVGSFERASPLSVAIAGHGEFLLNTMIAGSPVDTIYSFVTPRFDLLAGSANGTAASTAVIPEPATYALMALGLGAIGFSRRHRQSRAD